MEAAASNTAGAMTGFMGMGMAANAGANLSGLYQMGAGQQAAPSPAPQQTFQQDADTAEPAADTDRPAPKFCSQCGSPLQPGVKFCSQCGAKIF